MTDADKMIELHIEPPGSAAARWCLDQYFTELGAVFDTGYDPAQAAQLPEDEMTPPRGYFVVARLAGKPIGCGVLKRVNDSIGEIKRVWADPSARGSGIGRAMMLELERIAREAGLQRVRLDSNAKLIAAQALYRKLGYREIPRFNDDPYPTHWFGREL